ncbi:unnamed protein product [Bemisia tabaci]|uniref:Uncharacterized protein n=1 Tax=Bemisia tabaci TaxID=7038 RepID=A0A9P0A7Y1_BEMTA|nr:unnamed protein product [Bemisia tabaci]
MSSTQSYYKDRLGFDPNEPVDTTPFDKSKQGYEDNLVKFKALGPVVGLLRCSLVLRGVSSTPLPCLAVPPPPSLPGPIPAPEP